MTAYSTFYTFEVCPNCDEQKDTPACGELGSRDLKMDVSVGAP